MSTEIERLWKNGKLIGRRVRLRNPEGRGKISTVENLYDDIPGGVIVSPLLGGFRSWNICALELVEEHKGSNE